MSLRVALITETFLPTVNGIVKTLCILMDYLESAGIKRILFGPEGGSHDNAATKVVGLLATLLPFYP